MQRFGVAEGRSFSAFVNLNFYLASNSDVNSAVGGNRETALNHLRTYGIGEGRSFSEFVDVNAYLNYNPDVKQACSGNRVHALNHLEVYGVNEGRQFSPFVDLSIYLANYADLKQAFGSNQALALNHLETYGINEGRRFAAGFDVNYYRAANSGLAAAGINTNLLAYRHWVQYGFNEGRIAIADPGTGYYGTSPNGGAAKIGPLNQGHVAILSRSLSAYSGNNSSDQYQFTIDKTSTVYVHNLKSSGDNDVVIRSDYTPNATVAAASITYQANDSTAAILAPGTYHLEVSTVSTSQYVVSLEASAPVGVSAADIAGNSFDSAFNVSLQNKEHFRVLDYVDSSDQDDFYKINLSAGGSLQVEMSPLSADADLYLYNADRNLIGSSNARGATKESITSTLAKGTYYVKVGSYDGVRSLYSLNLQLN